MVRRRPTARSTRTARSGGVHGDRVASGGTAPGSAATHGGIRGHEVRDGGARSAGPVALVVLVVLGASAGGP